jgi:hypothetical protein
MAPTSVGRPRGPPRLPFSPSPHRARSRPVLRHWHCDPCSTSSAARRLGSGRPDRRSEPDVSPGAVPWVLDTGATTHMLSSDGILLSRLPPPSGITVGNGTIIPITSRGTSILSSPNSVFHLNNVLVAPDLVRNLLSVHQFTCDCDNNCSIEFDACGFSVKDQQTGRVTLRCNSDGDLYTFPSMPAHHCNLAITSSLWHQRLTTLQSLSVISYNKSSPCLCHACQLGKHVWLPL